MGWSLFSVELIIWNSPIETTKQKLAMQQCLKVLSLLALLAIAAALDPEDIVPESKPPRGFDSLVGLVETQTPAAAALKPLAADAPKAEETACITDQPSSSSSWIRPISTATAQFRGGSSPDAASLPSAYCESDSA